MGETESGSPPIAIEQWLDLIIASAAHRSQNEGQRRFGQALLNRYFAAVPERYGGDGRAAAYFDNMLCAVASAIRGFSVVRDSFQTNWETMKAAQQDDLLRARSLDRFSPLRKDGYWGWLVAIIAGLGLSAPVLAALNSRFSALSLPGIGMVIVCIAVVLFVVETLVDWLRGRAVRRSQLRFPQELMADWEDRALNGYRTVLKQFIPVAVEINERYYPGTTPANMAPDADLDPVLDRHFAFKPKPKQAKPQTS